MWSSTPLNSSSVKCSAGVDYHLPRADSLPPTQSGGQGDVLCERNPTSRAQIISVIYIKLLILIAYSLQERATKILTTPLTLNPASLQFQVTKGASAGKVCRGSSGSVLWSHIPGFYWAAKAVH